MKIGNVDFDIEHHTYIMGILNVTPDSFSDGGKYNQSIEVALQHVKEMMDEGCDMIDIGGESTRPGHTKITDQEEISRIVPIIKAIKEKYSIPISVDTYKSQVAKAAIMAGCDVINDIWGLQYDNDMAKVIKQGDVACCLMHNRHDRNYQCFMNDVINDLKQSVEIALSYGISKNKIILDPGVGFAKSYQENMEVIANLEVFHQLGFPLLLGTSRKSVIGLALDEDVNHRNEGTLATTALAVQHHYGFVRVHDVKENKRMIRMLQEVRKYEIR